MTDGETRIWVARTVWEIRSSSRHFRIVLPGWSDKAISPAIFSRSGNSMGKRHMEGYISVSKTLSALDETSHGRSTTRRLTSCRRDRRWARFAQPSDTAQTNREPAPGPWGSLVHPWWFGTTRLRFKSGRTHLREGSPSRVHPPPWNECKLFVRDRIQFIGSSFVPEPRGPRSRRAGSESLRHDASARTRARKGLSPSPNPGSAAGPPSSRDRGAAQSERGRPR